MLDKRKIDNLRDLLVGVVPNPIDQVKQITMALVYKFMNDMDSFNENFAGKKIYFVNDYAKYAWHGLMDEKLSNLERFHLYAEAIQALELNSQIPEIFQHIFKGAFLSYRNPETLTLFLREINGFDYNADSEQLGDAFEYLLSILGSQKDAGQFRTPRHIIDFIVKIIKPTKHDTILDPACGTAGFLISAFQYIRDTEKLELSEFAKVFDNIYGYDITPDMVKIALINLYLHGDTDPHIYEYDTLSSEDRWGDKFSCILANPPFMTPKGGIKPHKKFRIDATKSEVLFVDYILEHLRINGRAGIIVPEGIIFQSGNAYKKLRRMLVDGENGDGNLIAVISLPSGVFKPYSGVKTSILVVDKQCAKTTDKILLVKINNDGFDLGDKRTSITANDLPNAINTIEYYQKHGKLDDADSYIINNVLSIEKSVLAGNDYNLSFDRYKSNGDGQVSSYPMVKLGDVCEFVNGFAFKPIDWKSEGIPIVRIQNLTGTNGVYNYTDRTDIPEKYKIKNGDLLISWSASIGFYIWNSGNAYLNQHIFKVICLEKINKDYLYYLKDFIVARIHEKTHGNTMQHITKGNFESIEIPIPSLEIQQKMIVEIERYQKVIDGAKLVVDNYKPKISVKSEWQRVKLAEISRKITDGTHKTPNYVERGVPFLRVTDITGSNESKKYITESEHLQLIRRCKPEKGDILYSKNGTIGIAKLITWDFEFSIFVILALIKPMLEKVNPKFLEFYLNSEEALLQAFLYKKSGTVTNLHLIDIKQICIPLPTLEEQQKIVAALESEQQLVNNNIKLISIIQDKITQIISQIWNTQCGQID